MGGAGVTILLLSGPVACGKSTLARALVHDQGFRLIRSGAYLETLARTRGGDTSRRALQILGDALDAQTGFAWLIDEVAAPIIDAAPAQVGWLLDCARKPEQVAHFRRRFGGRVVHVHLVASEDELRRRYNARLSIGAEYMGATPYDEAIAHPNEKISRTLGDIADATIDTSDGDASARVLEHLSR